MAHQGRRNADSSLVAALAAGQMMRDAAAAAGVSVRTAHRRMADPAFRQQVSDARGELLSRAVGLLADASAEAATTLRRLLSARSEMARLLAARAILELVLKLRSETELEGRIAALEAAQGDSDARYPQPLRSA